MDFGPRVEPSFSKQIKRNFTVFFSHLQGWLVDLINKFGTLNGFQMLHDRFMSGQALNVQIIAALIK